MKVDSFPMLVEWLWQERFALRDAVEYAWPEDAQTDFRTYLLYSDSSYRSPIDFAAAFIGMVGRRFATERGWAYMGHWGGMEFPYTDPDCALPGFVRDWIESQYSGDFVAAREMARALLAEHKHERRIPFEIYTEIYEEGLPTRYMVRVSSDDPEMWCFTETEEAGRRDRQIRMRPGKLLKRLMPEQPNDWIQRVATAYTQGTALHQLKFACTEEEIVAVYKNGPSSCMSGGFDFEPHPVAVYAKAPIALAYLGTLERATARALVNTETKEWVRIYGNEVALSAALGAAGYAQSHYALEGCLIRRLSIGGDRYAMPYFDGGVGAEEYDNRYFKLTRHGGIASDGGSGWWSELGSGEDCDCCGDRTDEDDLSFIADEERSVCPSCLDAYYREAVYAVRGGTWRYRMMHRDRLNFIDVLDEWVSQDMDLGDLGVVEIDGEYYRDEDVVWDDWREEYVQRLDACLCTVSGDFFHREDLVTLHDGAFAHERYLGDQVLELGPYSSGLVDGGYARVDYIVTGVLTGHEAEGEQVLLADHVFEVRRPGSDKDEFYPVEDACTLADGSIAHRADVFEDALGELHLKQLPAVYETTGAPQTEAQPEEVA